MMVLTAKVDMKKIAIILGIVAAVIIGIIVLFGGGSSAQTSAAAITDNDSRVKFLKNLGWEVTNTPTESGQVRIPEESTEILDRYNGLQKRQGYDLLQYAGKNVMRYVYKINNFPDATDPVYATILVYKGQVIGGDITDTSAKGKVLPLKKAAAEETTPESTQTAPTK